MATKYVNKIKPGTASREVLFQKMGSTWYAIIIEGPDSDPIFTALPPGVSPEDKNFCLISLFEDGFDRTFDRAS